MWRKGREGKGRKGKGREGREERGDVEGFKEGERGERGGGILNPQLLLLPARRKLINHNQSSNFHLLFGLGFLPLGYDISE